MLSREADGLHVITAYKTSRVDKYWQMEVR